MRKINLKWLKLNLYSALRPFFSHVGDFFAMLRMFSLFSKNRIFSKNRRKMIEITQWNLNFSVNFEKNVATSTDEQRFDIFRKLF